MRAKLLIIILLILIPGCGAPGARGAKIGGPPAYLLEPEEAPALPDNEWEPAPITVPATYFNQVDRSTYRSDL